VLKSWTRGAVLAVQAGSGASSAFFVLMAIVTFASLSAFIFLCIAVYDWMSQQTSSVTAGLIMAGIFVLIAIIGLIVSTLVRRRTRQCASLERAARAQAPSWLLDPKILATAIQVSRALGWQRIVPIAVLGCMAAQWAREHREHGHKDF